MNSNNTRSECPPLQSLFKSLLLILQLMLYTSRNLPMEQA
jgi:hypothetical protein